MTQLSCWVVTLLSCQITQKQVLHEDTVQPQRLWESLRWPATEDSSGLAEADECKSQTCKDNSLSEEAIALSVMFSL